MPRLKPKYKHKNSEGKTDSTSLDESVIIRFTKRDLNKRVEFILSKEVCQVCENSTNLDGPHHAKSGSSKDDRYLINICIYCHREIHFGSFDNLMKSRDEVVYIGWENHLEFLESVE